MEEMVITAEIRKEKGKSTARKIRKQGYIPAILYGRNTQTNMLMVSEREWKRLSKNLKKTSILKMQLKKNGQMEDLSVMVKAIQKEAYKDNILHIDFLHISMERKIEVEVPIHLKGKAKGIVNNGVVEQHLRTIMVECLPTRIPEKIDVDVTELDIGDSIHVGDLSKAYPELKFLEHPEVAVVTVIPPETGEEAKVEEETEKEEA
ncbi:MAG TPA: 50S ribosomal protein L25 [Syntrophorhabdaceae bacterium]|nr:50S ribosomal protein L25 [Syntrophorhabdaceae bacterium]HPU30906.1 50S ribosomal protein L25 [Syntrophorhabdaceae bacterium]